MARYLVLILLMSGVARVSSVGYFSCTNLTPHSCSCSSQTPTVYELLCPSELTVHINLHDSVQLQCINDQSAFSTLSGLQIGDVERFVLRLCPLPDTSIRDLMASIGIKKIKMLQIQSYGSYNDSLKKKHFEKLDFVTNLSLNNNGLTSLPSDIFEDMKNLTWLDMKHNFIDFPKEIFYFTPKLEVLELGKNNLTHLKPGIFKNLERLRLLNLWGNELKNLTRDVFSDVPNLESLDLNSNQMETIRPDLFSDLMKLKRLNLYANAFISLPKGLLSRNTELEEFQMHENKRSVNLSMGLLSNLTKLKLVRLSGCKMTSLPEDIFSGSKNIATLYLNQNSLTTLAEKTFIDLEDLEVLDLSQNQITRLPETLFMRTRKLKTLKLYYNQLVEIPPRLLLQLKNLEFLDLRFNRLKEIRGEQFYNLESLKALNISDNQLTTLATTLQISDFGNYSVLEKCNKLEDLQLANNSLTEIYADWRLLKNKLHTLNLAFNKIQLVVFKDSTCRTILDLGQALRKIEDLDFISFDVAIDLSSNNISLVSFWKAELVALNHLESANTTYERDRIKPRHVKFDNNPFNCDCRLLPFVQFLSNGLSPELQFLFDIPGNNLKCHEPKTLENTMLPYVPQDLLTCDIENKPGYVCPENCTCHYRSLNRGHIINCQYSDLKQTPPILPMFETANHSELILDGNQLEKYKMPDGKGYENVTHLYLSHNNITDINITGASVSIKVLDLSYNNLTALNSETILQLESASELVFMALHNNPWRCDCDAKPLIRLIKNRFQQVNHQYNVTCSNGISIVEVEESELCSEKAGVLIIICMICAILGFIVALLTFLYYRYRTEIHVYCYTSNWKVLQWLVSHPDCDESKKYDAFISYANNDEKFVTEKLVPVLEGEKKFKLCLHYRDFIPGDTIPDQILRSVQSSRRTVIVLSPSYLKSTWGMVEFKTAHAEALRNGTSRVIVILYLDVGPVQNLDEDFKAYLQLNTYLKWDSPWFWKQLIYALPHPPEDADDMKCIFGCFPRISKDSRSHQVLRNVQLQNGEVHYVTESSDKTNSKESNIPPSTNPTFIIESMIEETKPKISSPDKHQNGSAVIAV